MNNDFLIRYETDLINKTTKEVTEDVRKTIAKNLKDIIFDEEIARSTSLSPEEVKTLSPQP